MKDDKVILTPEQAEALLPAGEYVHNFSNPDGMLVGVDYDRADAVKALKAAKQIELGGDSCMRLEHPIVCWHTENRYTFFAADMEKVQAFEAAALSAAT